jgi:hypothetical protein
MKIFVCIMLMGLGGIASAQEKSSEQQIRETLRALPEALRDDATVIGYEDGERKTLRAGSNDIICRADDPNMKGEAGAFYVNCFPKSLEAFLKRIAELGSEPDWMDALSSEVKSGRLKMPEMAIRYTLRGSSAEGALPLAAIHIPFATAESTGLSTEPDNHRPWLMMESTVMAHIMLPGL